MPFTLYLYYGRTRFSVENIISRLHNENSYIHSSDSRKKVWPDLCDLRFLVKQGRLLWAYFQRPLKFCRIYASQRWDEEVPQSLRKVASSLGLTRIPIWYIHDTSETRAQDNFACEPTVYLAWLSMLDLKILVVSRFAKTGVLCVRIDDVFLGEQRKVCNNPDEPARWALQQEVRACPTRGRVLPPSSPKR